MNRLVFFLAIFSILLFACTLSTTATPPRGQHSPGYLAASNCDRASGRDTGTCSHCYPAGDGSACSSDQRHL